MVIRGCVRFAFWLSLLTISVLAADILVVILFNWVDGMLTN
jgi:hypothetical protein